MFISVYVVFKKTRPHNLFNLVCLVVIDSIIIYSRRY